MRSERRPGIGRILPLLKPRWRDFAWMFVIGGVIQALNVLTPYLSRLLIDRAYPAHDVSLMHVLVGATVAMTGSSVLVANGHAYFGRLVQSDLYLDLAARLYAHVVDLPIEFFQNRRSGEISSRFHIIRSSMMTVVVLIQVVARNYGFLIVVPLLLVGLDPVLGLVAISVIPPIAYLTFREARCVNRDTQEHLARIAELDSFQAETCAKMRSLKGLHLEGFCRDRFRALAGDAAVVQRKKLKTHASYNTAANALRGASLCACLWLGWESILAGTLSLGEFIAFMAYFNYLSNPLREVVDSLGSSIEAAGLLGAVTDVLERPSEASVWLRDAPASVPSGSELACHGVTFAYDSSPAVFSDLDVAFPARTVTAIVGLSGAGKTTLLQLLVGFSAPQAGRITLGGTDIRTIPLDALRSRIGVVWQDDALLSASLWENLTVGAAVPRARVDRVVELCQLTDVVRALPDGYATRVGDKGVRLSAGQRQRVALARAIVRQTPVVLLDEVTANVDLFHEASLLTAVARECRDRVLVLVTHRATTAMLADRVLHCARGTLCDVTDDIKGIAQDRRQESVEVAMRAILGRAASPAGIAGTARARAFRSAVHSPAVS